MSICLSKFYFSITLKVDLLQMSNGENSMVLACRIAYLSSFASVNITTCSNIIINIIIMYL